MFLSITSTSADATDLGYLLHKHPDRVQHFTLKFGTAHVFYPQADAQRCTANLVLDIEPEKLARRRTKLRGRSFMLSPYVNDRPYAASSFLSVAIAQVYSSALKGQCKQRPELVDQPLNLQARIVAVPCRGDAELLLRLFEPLGYSVNSKSAPLDEQFPEWGASRYFDLTLAGQTTLQNLLEHLYVLLPVLDDEKHYWVGEDELQKLLTRAGDWLQDHPEKTLITRRYLKHRRGLIRSALEQLRDETDTAGKDALMQSRLPSISVEEPELETKLGLHDQRLQTVAAELVAANCTSVLDLGCGEGKLLELLLAKAQFRNIVGLDVSTRALKIAERRLRLDRLPAIQRARIKLIQGALTYRDDRWKGFDAACLIEVIEHLDFARLEALSSNLFADAQPALVVVTTPNAEYNPIFGLETGQRRHRDHRFEWTRVEFQSWAEGQTSHGYRFELFPIGELDPDKGAASQMAVFRR